MPFKSANKWGIKKNEQIIIDPVYDTIFNFDNTNKVCLACFKIKGANSNKFIKTSSVSFSCNYLNMSKKHLTIKNETNDTTSIFSLHKNSLKELYDDKDYFIVTNKNKKYLLDKKFNQITFTGYHTIALSNDPNFLVVEEKTESGQIYTGLINTKEKKIIDFNYSGIKLNTFDSLIIACSSGVNPNADDDVFDYNGKKIFGFKRHIDFATKTFIIHKIFEPSEYYIIYNLNTKKESILNVLEVKQYNSDEILVRLKNNWFVYNLVSGEKKPYDMK
ncbi:MAG: hypothetical protein SFY56_05620 [Bacteroidota bacterium]|nr:hypothetical protein [Bacteroidota bacterium]